MIRAWESSPDSAFSGSALAIEELRLDDWAQIVRANGRDMVRANLAEPLDKRKHRFLANSARCEVLALATVFVLLQSANECFVNLDHLAFAAKLHGEMTGTHGLAKTIAHEPSSFVR
jgi:hypothetical protein